MYVKCWTNTCLVSFISAFWDDVYLLPSSQSERWAILTLDFFFRVFFRVFTRWECLKMSSLKSSCWAALHSAKWLPFYVKGNAENESLMWLYLQMLDCTAVLGVSQGLVQEIDHMNNKNNCISSRYCGQCIYWESLVMHALWLKGWWDALHFFCRTGVHLMAHSSLYPQPISITSPTVSIIVELPLPFFPKV